MQITELFSSALKNAIEHNKHGNIQHFLPSSCTSIPDIQENMLYVCAFGSFSFDPFEEFSFQDIDGYLLFLTLSGEGFIETTDIKKTAAPSSLLLWNCRNRIRFLSGKNNWSGISLYFNGKNADVYFKEIRSLDFPLYELSQSSAEECLIKEIPAYGTIASTYRAICQNRILTDLLTELLFRFSDNTHQDPVIPDYIIMIKKSFDENYADDFSMEKLSSEFGINRFRLSREFSQYIGLSPVKYLTQVRLEHAKILLETTDFSIGKTGAAVGIDNTTHFIKLFKAYNGITPQAYRRKYLSLTDLRKY